MNTQSGPRAHWGSRLAFILAAAGSAIGLGNLWKFPYEAGSNGGGAFVIVYLAMVAMVGVPLLIAELYIGQKAQKNTVEAYEAMDKKGTPWRLPGWLGLASAFLILSFYSVVGGWILDFEFRSIMNEFAAGEALSGGQVSDSVKAIFGSLLESPGRQVFWHFIFMALSAGIVLAGVKDGLERWTKILMPALFLILAGLLVYSFFMEGFGEAMAFLFQPDFRLSIQSCRFGSEA